jgi:hypothetical protein
MQVRYRAALHPVSQKEQLPNSQFEQRKTNKKFLFRAKGLIFAGADERYKRNKTTI